MSLSPTVLTAFSALGSIFKGYTAYQQGKYQQQIAEYNARVQENQAIREQNAAIEAARDRKLQARALAAKQSAALAASGVDIGSGSSLDILDTTDLYEGIDLYRISQNADSRVSALNQGAALSRLEGANAASEGRAALMGTLLTGATKVAGEWYKQTRSSDSWKVYRDRNDDWMGP